MTTDVIGHVEVVDLRDWTGPGDDGLFVAVRGAGRTGWYGPVGDELAQYVDSLISDAVVGLDFTDHLGLQAAMRKAVSQRPGRAASWAVGAVDCAAWDLHGQTAGVPVATLLSTGAAMTVRLYASWLRLDVTDPSTVDAVARVGASGWLFTKWGLRRGLTDDIQHEAARFAQAVSRTADALDQQPAFDAVFTWSHDVAQRFAQLVDPDALKWLEDPLPRHDIPTYQSLSPLPLAIGERLLIDHDPIGLLKLELRAFTIDVVGCGGLTTAVQLIERARAAGIPVYPHGRSLIPAMHLAAAFPDNIPAVEYQLQWEPIRQLLFAEPWLPMHGLLTVPVTPGLGLTPRSR